MSSPAVPKFVVGYFVASSIHTTRYAISDIPAESLTHLVYGFAQVDAGGQCRPQNPADDQINLPQLAQLKARHPNLSVLLGIGGPFGSGGFASAAATPLGRTSFIASCLSAMKAGGFDGIEISWQTPGSAEAIGFTQLLSELRSQLDVVGAADSRHYLLSTALPARVDQAQVLQISQVQASVDWINLMAYDFYTAATNPRTELQSALFPSSQDAEPDAIKRANYNVESAVRGYLSVGTPAAKLVLGLNFTGQIWTGVAAMNDGLYQPAAGPGGAAGWLDYADIAANYLPTHQRYWSSEAHVPWLYSPVSQTMVSYDDAQSLAAKVAFSLSNGLAGVSLWSLDADDSHGTLIESIQEALRPAGSSTAEHTGVLPYAAEPFGVFQPLAGWVGQQNYRRVSGADNSTYLDRRTALELREQGLGGRWTSGVFKASAAAIGVLSPIGLLHRARLDFFELDTQVGPPVGQVWVSPGGTVELAEVSTGAPLDLPDAIQADNAANVRLADAPVAVGDTAITLSLAAARGQAQQEIHRHTRAQSERISGGLRRSVRTAFRTPVGGTERRYVVGNAGDELVNYELRRKMRRVAVQSQDLGTVLAWQVHLDEPGRDLALGAAGAKGEAVETRPAADLRAEERQVVFSQLVGQLMGDSVRQVSADLLRALFDVDAMVYFLAPDTWRPQPESPGERPSYPLGEESAPRGSSLGWVIQPDGDARRNEFLNAAWVNAVLPVRAGRELEALAWLKSPDVEGESGLSDPYVVQPGDPDSYAGKTVGDVLDLLAGQLRAANTDIANQRATELAFDRGFTPLEGGLRAGDPYQVFDQWIEIVPTDQIVAVAQ